MTTPNINRILAGPLSRSCKYGAPMGRSNRFDGTSACHLQRVTFVDGCYSRDGTYWGAPANLWAAFTRDLKTLAFVRAADRVEAMRLVRALAPDVPVFHSAARKPRPVTYAGSAHAAR